MFSFSSNVNKGKVLRNIANIEQLDCFQVYNKTKKIRMNFFLMYRALYNDNRRKNGVSL